MSNANKYPAQTPEAASAAQAEQIQFSDGEVAFSFENPGDAVDLSPSTTFKYAQTLRSGLGTDLAIIKTRSGNAYGVGMGFIINNRERATRELTEDFELPQVIVGEPWQLPDGTRTTPVEKIVFRYTSMSPGQGGRQIGSPSPFPALQQELEQIREKRGLPA